MRLATGAFEATAPVLSEGTIVATEDVDEGSADLLTPTGKEGLLTRVMALWVGREAMDGLFVIVVKDGWSDCLLLLVAGRLSVELLAFGRASLEGDSGADFSASFDRVRALTCFVGEFISAVRFGSRSRSDAVEEPERLVATVPEADTSSKSSSAPPLSSSDSDSAKSKSFLNLRSMQGESLMSFVKAASPLAKGAGVLRLSPESVNTTPRIAEPGTAENRPSVVSHLIAIGVSRLRVL